jgi:hypothetical protein
VQVSAGDLHFLLLLHTILFCGRSPICRFFIAAYAVDKLNRV